jgi:hypothetical protein
MSEIKKKVRQSLSGETEYQIEYKVKSAGLLSEYRVRRGARGTWTKWFRTQNIGLLLFNLGFDGDNLSLLNDFYFESYFGRGMIRLNKMAATAIVDLAGIDEIYTHFYSRLKQVSDDLWVLPASALETKRMFHSLEELIAVSIS